jgi:hypothetical protein
MLLELAATAPYSCLSIYSQGPENKMSRLICKKQYLKQRPRLMFGVTGQWNIYSTHSA